MKKLAYNSTFKKQRSWHPVPSLHGKYMGKQGQILFSWAPKSLHVVTVALLLGKKAMTNLDSILKNRDITLLTTDYIVKAMVFSVVM